MAHFSDDWLHELYSRINIADIISNYVNLQSKSGSLWACCPFHNEKTPSFSVNSTKGLYHCFGCGKGGNAIQFIMDIERLSFPEACAFLAQKINLPLPQEKFSKKDSKKKTLKTQILKMNKIACDYFIKSLKDVSGNRAREYLSKRNLNNSVTEHFKIGYAPDGWNGLTSLLLKKGFTSDLIAKSGLVRIKNDNMYDYFRDRIIFPIFDAQGYIIGFGGRIIDEGEPKYLNTPETAVFNKSQNLYNLNFIKGLKSLDSIILAEGYMDVIGLYRYGIKNTVATLGTSLTLDQIRLIKRYCDNIYISYDGDSAGKKAAVRAVGLFKKEGLECKIINIPDNLDPDEYITKNGTENFNRLIRQAKSAVRFKIDTIAENYDLNDGNQKETFVKECINILKLEESSVIREKYANYLADKTGFTVSSILQDIDQLKNNEIDVEKKACYNHRRANHDNNNEDYIIMRLLDNPLLAADLQNKLSASMFWDKTNRDIYKFLFIQNKRGFQPTTGEILSIVDDEMGRSRITKLLMNADEEFENGKKNGHYLADNIKNLYIRNKEAEISSYLNLSKNTENQLIKKKLTQEINKLTQELYSIKRKTDYI